MPELVLPVGHTEGVFSGAYSPDGKLVVTASNDETAKIWSSQTGKIIHSLEGHSQYVSQAVWSPDGSGVLTAGRNRALTWDVRTGQVLLDLKPHQSPLILVSWSPDGNSILTTSQDRTVKIWDAGSGKLLFHLEDLPQPVYSASWSPDSRKILVSSWSAMAGIWDLQTGKLVCTLKKYAGYLNSAQWSPDGTRILSSSNNRDPMVWNARTGKMIYALTGHTLDVNAASWSPDGNNILTTARDSNLIIWESGRGKTVHVIREGDGYVHKAEWSPDGRKIACSLSNGRLCIRDVSTGAKTREINSSDGIATSISWSPDNRHLLITGGGVAPAIWDVGSGRIHITLSGHTRSLASARFLPGETAMIVSSDDGIIRKWDLLSGKIVSKTRNVFLYSSTLSPDRTKMVVESDDHTIKVMGASSASLIQTFQGFPGDLRSVEWFANGKEIFLSSQNKLGKVFDIESGKCLLELDGRDDYPKLVKLSPDRTKYMTQSYGGTTKVWELSSGELLQSFYGNFSVFVSNSWSPDNKYILSLDSDSTATILDVASGNQNPLYPDHGNSINTLYWAGNGNRIVSSAYDRTSRIWDASSGKLLQKAAGTVPEHKTAFPGSSADWMFTDSWTGSIQLWDLLSGECLHSYSGPEEKIDRIIWNPDHSLFLGIYEKKVCLWSTSSEKPQTSVDLGLFSFEDVDFNKERAISFYNSQLKLNDLRSGTEIAQFIAIDSGDYFVKTPDNYYLASKNGLKWVGFKVNHRHYSFEQFDLKYNRPDIVLQRLGSKDSTLIGLYKRAYQKRLKKMGFKEEDLGDDFHIPETRIRDFENPPLMDQSEVTLNLDFRDSKYLLERYHVLVNGVPVFGRKGKRLPDHGTKTVSIAETISLTPGNNRIQVSCLNNKGAESYKEILDVKYQPEHELKPDLYLVCVGVSDYQDDQYDLKFADKDGRDLVDFYLSGQSLYANIYLDTLFNEQVTPERVKRIKSHLKQSKVNDHVITLVSGHGILDDSLDFYFATHPMDFSEPSARGILYEEFEDLLDGITARNKILLIDACHSGEIDKDEVEEYLVDNAVEGEVQFLKGNAERHLKVNALSEIMNGLFVDIRSGNGATVLTAAKGAEFAEESISLGNGVFTYALISGLKTMAADKNGDGQVDLAELRSYVTGEVTRITEGRQMPTSRQENIEFNHRVW